MAKIKVVIFDDYGASYFPKHIQDQIKEEKFPEERCGSIIEILEKYPSHEENEELQEKYDKLKVDEVLRVGNRFYFGAEPFTIQCSIVEVDTDNKWKIDEYDGSEYIEYLNYECLSKELNYWA